MQLSIKTKDFFSIFLIVLKPRLSFEYFEKKDDNHN